MQVVSIKCFVLTLIQLLVQVLEVGIVGLFFKITALISFLFMANVCLLIESTL